MMTAEFTLGVNANNKNLLSDMLEPVMPEMAEAIEKREEHPQVTYGLGKESVTITIPTDDYLKLAAHYKFTPDRRLNMAHPPFAATWAALTSEKSAER